MSRACLLLAALWCVCSSYGCARPAASPKQAPADSPRTANVEEWRQGTSLFRQDPGWVGADSAYSVDLGDRRVLWLFGDTFIDPQRDGSRVNGPNFFVRNSVAIQSGADASSAHNPTLARMTFYWGAMQEELPHSFFRTPDDAEHWLWPLAGVRLPQGTLLLFRMQVHKISEGLGFAVSGWDAVAVDDPSAEPSAWQLRTVQPLTTTPRILVGASVLIHDQHLYAYSVQNDDQSHKVFLARWPLSTLGNVAEGALADPAWYSDDSTFLLQSQGAVPRELFDEGQTEFSVHYDAPRKRFVEIQMRGLLLKDPRTALAFRSATSPHGPWSPLVALYRPPQASLPNAEHLIAYAGKAHPEQHGPGLVASYVVHDMHAPIPDDTLYYPQLVRMQWP